MKLSSSFRHRSARLVTALLLGMTPLAQGATNKPPSLPKLPGVTVAEGAPLRLTIPAATDPEGQPITYAMEKLPGWARFDSESRVVSGTPPYSEASTKRKVKTYSPKVIATDSSGKRGTKVFQLRVTDAPESAARWQGKAIDGYLSGATVFVDLNWNATMDPGEPTAISGDGGVFSLDPATLPGCAAQRPIIVDVPAGAVDTQLGVVDEPFRLYFLPTTNHVFGPSTTGNVTPLTTLLAAAIDSAKATLAEPFVPPSPADACADAVSAELYLIVQTLVADELRHFAAQYGISPEALYADYLASGDAAKQAIAERAAAFLKGLVPLSLSVRNHFDSGKFAKSEVNLTLDPTAAAALLGGGAPSFLPISLYAQATAAPAGGWVYEESVLAVGAMLNLEGRISLPSSAWQVPSYGSLLDASTYMRRGFGFGSTAPQDLGLQRVSVWGAELHFDFKAETGLKTCEYAEHMTGLSNRFDDGSYFEYEFSRGLGRAEWPAYCRWNGDEHIYVFKMLWNADRSLSQGVQYAFKTTDALANLPSGAVVDNRDRLDISSLVREIAALPFSMGEVDAVRAFLRDHGGQGAWATVSRSFMEGGLLRVAGLFVSAQGGANCTITDRVVPDDPSTWVVSYVESDIPTGAGGCAR